MEKAVVFFGGGGWGGRGGLRRPSPYQERSPAQWEVSWLEVGLPSWVSLGNGWFG